METGCIQNKNKTHCQKTHSSSSKKKRASMVEAGIFYAVIYPVKKMDLPSPPTRICRRFILPISYSICMTLWDDDFETDGSKRQMWRGLGEKKGTQMLFPSLHSTRDMIAGYGREHLAAARRVWNQTACQCAGREDQRFSGTNEAGVCTQPARNNYSEAAFTELQQGGRETQMQKVGLAADALVAQ